MSEELAEYTAGWVDGLATVKVNPVADESYRKLRAECSRVRDFALSAQVHTIDEARSATNDLSMIAGLKKAIEEKRFEWVKPLNAYVHQVNAAFKAVSDLLDEGDRELRRKCLAWKKHQDELAAKAKEARRLQAEAERLAGDVLRETGELIDTKPIVVPAPEPVKSVYAAAGTFSARKVRKWRLVSFAQVPDEYKVLDSAKINKVVKAGGTIAGIEAYEEDSTVVVPAASRDAQREARNGGSEWST